MITLTKNKFENNYNKFENYIKLIIKNIILNFKFLFSNLFSIIFFLFFAFLPVITTMFFIPFFTAGPLFFQFPCIIPILISYGSLTYTFRQSTLYKNLKITKNSNLTFYIASYLTLNFLAILLFFFSFFILFISDKLLILQDGWLSNSKDPNKIVFWPIQWIDIFYSIFISNLLSFAFSYFLVSIFDKKTYYTIVSLVIILIIIFGGTINNYFHGDSNHPLYFLPTLFPKSMFYPVAIFFPFYSIGETSSIITRQMCNTVSSTSKIFNEFEQTNFKFISLLIIPYIHIMIFIILGKFLSYKLKK